MNGWLLTIEGIDGAGKSTLRAPVAELLSELGVVPYDTKQPASAPEFARVSMTKVARLLWSDADTTFDHLLGAHYWLYLQAMWYSLSSRFVIEPKLSEGQRLLTDGWYFKFYAKLQLRGFDPKFLDAVFEPALVPHVTVLIVPDVSAVWSRRAFRRIEMGLHEGYVELGRESFIDYQTRVQRQLRELAARYGWAVAEVPPHERPCDTAERVAQTLLDGLESSPPRSRTSALSWTTPEPQ